MVFGGGKIFKYNYFIKLILENPVILSSISCIRSNIKYIPS